MRIDVKKFLFIGNRSHLDRFLTSAQKEASIQFVIKPKPLTDLIGSHVYDVIRAIKILRQYENPQALDPRRITIRNPFHFASEIIKMKDECEKIDCDLKILSTRLLVAQFFGTIPWDTISILEASTSLRVRFFEGSTFRQFATHYPELLPIHDAGEKSYFISLLFHSEQLPTGLREIRRDEIQEIDMKRQTLIERRRALEELLRIKSQSRLSLQEALSIESSAARLDEAKNMHRSEIDGTLFILSGWVPDILQEKVANMAGKEQVISEEILPDPSEIAPTYLENSGWSRVGEDLIYIYDTPSNSDKDPSWWVLGFFALFFAMIVGDAGYGLVFLIIAYTIQKTKKPEGLGKRVVNLVKLLGISCVGWGFLCHSFFGISFSEKSVIAQSSLLQYVVEKRAEYEFQKQIHHSQISSNPSTNHTEQALTLDEFLLTPDSKGITLADTYADNALFEVALFIGIIHMVLGMLRYYKKNYANLSWSLFIIGAYLYLPAYLGATSFSNYLFHIEPSVAASLGKLCMGLGFGFSMLYTIYIHGITGIFEAMMAVQLFADSLSYLRLYALGLAGGLVSKIINDAAATTPIAISVILFITSHVINIILATAGGILHGLRLNFLEWYHYSFEGGGKKFIPLSHEERI